MPRKVICFALRRKSVPEYLVDGVMSLYKSCKTAVSVGRELSSSFSVEVESTFIYYGKGWFINGVVVCRRSCFVWGIIK